MQISTGDEENAEGNDSTITPVKKVNKANKVKIILPDIWHIPVIIIQYYKELNLSLKTASSLIMKWKDICELRLVKCKFL
jgi:hypothetical protein